MLAEKKKQTIVCTMGDVIRIFKKREENLTKDMLPLPTLCKECDAYSICGGSAIN